MIITIGGQYGCGAKRIAALAAELLGYRLCDDEIVMETVKNSGVDMTAETFAYYDESQGEASVKQIATTSAAQKQGRSFVGALAMDVLPLDRQLGQIQQQVLTQFADADNCVILGRCANYYLKDRENRVSIFVVDDDPARVRRIMNYLSVSEAEAAKIIKKTDKRRSDYHAYFTGKKWDDPNNYDLYLNCSLLGVEGTAKLLQTLVTLKSQA